MDSLAATGTRFQRQIRTDRVRPGTAGRSRASTASSTGSVGRGHSKSLSTSSITSLGSVDSNYSQNQDVRRRPPPLVMANPRSRFSLESYGSAREHQLGYRPVTPTEFSTPTSATFSTPGHNSPRWGSGMASPISSHSRAHSMYATGSHTPGRRLSVPSSGNPFSSPHGVNLGRTLFGPTSNPPGQYTPGSSALASPTASTVSTWSRRDSASRAADEEWRRRTWHPDTGSFNGGSRLSQVITPAQFTPPQAAPPPLADVNAQPGSAIRLPGIESFDPIMPGRPPTPPRRNPSPMMIDSDAPHAHPPPLLPSAEGASEDRRNVSHWDMGLHRGLTRLDINTPPRESAGAWATEAQQALEQARMNEGTSQGPPQPSVRFDEVKQVYGPQHIGGAPPMDAPLSQPRVLHQHTMSAPALHAHREAKRHGWYGGNVTIHPGPAPQRAERMIHPNLVNGFSGFPAREPTVSEEPRAEEEMARTHPTMPSNSDPQLRRLEALVAVATSEGSTATAY
jgi:C2H2 transcription facotor